MVFFEGSKVNVPQVAIFDKNMAVGKSENLVMLHVYKLESSLNTIYYYNKIDCSKLDQSCCLCKVKIPYNKFMLLGLKTFGFDQGFKNTTLRIDSQRRLSKYCTFKKECLI